VLAIDAKATFAMTRKVTNMALRSKDFVTIPQVTGDGDGFVWGLNDN
jgi:hypothetical protein